MIKMTGICAEGSGRVKVLAVILMMTGAAFLIMGAFIFFGKRYSLINGFDADLKAHRRDEKYARRVGIAELAVGTVLTAVGAVLIFCDHPADTQK